MEQPLYAGALRATPSTRFINISKPFDHSAGSVRLLFYSSTTDPNEKWSLHDLRVTPSYVPVTLSFDKTVVKAGKSYLEGRDVRGTITATIRPVAGAPAISFTSSNGNRATVSETGRVNRDGATIVTLKVSGESPTPTDFPQGDAQVEARRGNNVLRTAQLKVVIPRHVTFSVGAATYRNYAIPSDVAGYVFLGTYMRSIIQYNVKDQFENTLDPIYNGSRVVEERFPRVEQNYDNRVPGLTMDWNAVAYPVGDNLTNGTKLDESSVRFLYRGVRYATNIGTAWVANRHAITIGGRQMKNAHRAAIYASGLEYLRLEGRQELRVHGFWTLTPNSWRRKIVRNHDYPPSPLTVTQTPQ